MKGGGTTMPSLLKQPVRWYFEWYSRKPAVLKQAKSPTSEEERRENLGPMPDWIIGFLSLSLLIGSFPPGFYLKTPQLIFPRQRRLPTDVWPLGTLERLR